MFVRSLLLLCTVASVLWPQALATPRKLATNAPNASTPSMHNVVGDVLYYQGPEAGSGSELWRSDGSLAGTGLVKDISPGTGSSFPHDFVDLGGVAYFGASGPQGTELWKS